MISNHHIWLLAIAIIAFLASLGGVHLFREYALSRGHIDIPNDRSSHETPTPRGGGIVIAVVVLIVYLGAAAALESNIAIGYLVGATLVISISWLYDVRSVAFHWRFLVHTAAAVCLLLDSPTVQHLYIPYAEAVLPLGIFGPLIATVAIVWMINAYNFMDGIDGIAGAQAVTASVGWLLIAARLDDSLIVFFAMAILASSLGFLVHNWPPATIFMGDAGSAFLGFTFAAMPLLVRSPDDIWPGILPWLTLALVWLFVFDSVVTVLGRLVRREKIWQAHRSHLYQRMVINGLSHRRVTGIYFMLSAGIMVTTSYLANDRQAMEIVTIPAVILSTLVLIVAFLMSKKGVSSL